MLFSLSLIAGGIVLNTQYRKELKEKELQEKIELEKKKKEARIQEIRRAYSNFVKTKTETDLYVKENDTYTKVGLVSANYNLELGEIEINFETEYFPIKGTNYFIKYNVLDKIDKLDPVDNRYKSYIVFNENVITKENAKFYRKDNSWISINKSFTYPIIEKDNDKYYFEYNKELFYVQKTDVKDIEKANNSKEETRSNIRVLTYHTIYDPKTQKCTNTTICHPISQFESHMKYLSDNKYLTLTMNELEMFLDGKIQIPKKTIVITLDDGKYATNAINIVEKYKVYATYFYITSAHDVPKVETTYMNFQSHTHDLHNNWKCPGGNQGGQLLCEDENKVLEDLKKNKELLGGDVFAFAYPFFDWNERAIKLLKQSGFRLAFVGQYDTDGYSDGKTNRFLLRRKTIFSTDSMETFISRLA